MLMFNIHSSSAHPYDARTGSREIIRAVLFSLLLIFSIQSGRAQQGPVVSPAPTAQNDSKDSSSDRPPTAVPDTRYRIGPGDVLEVRVLRAPELSRDAVRVDQRGLIRMPMLDDDIQAACFTEAELAQNMVKLYLKYKRDPHVEVFVKEFQSQPVAVIGAVRGPAQFKLQRQVRLLELLSFAGGPAESAGQTVQIVHAGGHLACDKSTTLDSDESPFVAYKLSDTLHGLPEANPYVRPGDIVSVPEADQVYVLGNVMKPSVIPMKEPLTVLRAIAMAGGTAPATKKDRVRIIRQVPGNAAKQEIYIDLKAIEQNRAEDVALLANDIVDVPASGTKVFLRSLVGAFSQLPVRVIP